jgi:hypothetical protein
MTFDSVGLREKVRNFTGKSFWARGFYVSTVGLDEDVLRGPPAP